VSRVIAVVVAVLLVVVAVVVRGRLDDDGGSGGEPRGDGTVRVVCAEELRAACAALSADVDVTVEDAAQTAARLDDVTAPSVLDVWAVPAPWPSVVDETRREAGLAPLFGGDGTAVAASPIVVVGPDSLGDCDWRCIGDRAGDDLTVGGRGVRTGLGTLTVGAAAAGWFGRPDFAANDFDPAFTSWLGGLFDDLTATDAPVTRLLQSRAFFDAALSYEAEAAGALDAASADRKAGLALLYPAPVAMLDVVVVGIGDVDARSVADDLGPALTDEGWGPPADGASTLPRPGVVIALRELVR
jgi:hypothetical protein